MAPHTPLARRAQVTVNGWLGILIIVILASAALFCIVITVIICSRKRARKQRERKMLEEQSTPFVAQQPPQAFVAQEYNAHEYRVAGNDRSDVELGTKGPVELQGGMAEETRMKPQQIDGYVAPATMAYDGRPVEMPAQTVTR